MNPTLVHEDPIAFQIGKYMRIVTNVTLAANPLYPKVNPSTFYEIGDGSKVFDQLILFYSC